MARARGFIALSSFLCLMTLAEWIIYPQLMAMESQFHAPSPAQKQLKISSSLLQALERQLKGRAAEEGWPLHNRAIDINAQGLQVYIELQGFAPSVVGELGQRGVHIEVVEPTRRLIQARIPVDRLDEVSQLPFVKFIRPPDYGYPDQEHGYPDQQGAVGTEGDRVIRAAVVRRQLGVTGASIRVGVISTGIRGLSQSIASGDLPPQGVTSRSFRADGNLEAEAEGTAMLEIIHDIAPGATLFFANVNTDLEFIQAVNWLADEAGGPNPRRGTPGGVDILVEDLSFFNGPFDGSSPVSQALGNAAVRGVAVFASAGNRAQRHYQGAFVDTDGDTIHDFDVSLGQPRVDGAGETLTVTVRPGERISIYLQWDDPFGASGNDYDLCVHRPPESPTSPNTICSDDLQDGNDDPTERLHFLPNGSTPITYGISIINVQGRAAPRTFELFLVGGVMHEFVVPDSSIPNGGDSHFIVSVGAVPWQTPGVIEPFSSRGPTNDGRLKPDLVAPDGVSVTGAGGFPSTFFGTSAAAPHAGALAALILSVNPTFTPDVLRAMLTATAIPLGAPSPNQTFGFGRADAFTVFGPTSPILGDYDGDGRTDIALYGAELSSWYMLLSSSGQLRTVPFGSAGFEPVPGDYDGDGRADLALRDPAASTWYIIYSSTNQQQVVPFGSAGFEPVPGDYDGDGRTDFALRDPGSSTWYIIYSSTGQLVPIPFGL
jgi:hypothetical protein